MAKPKQKSKKIVKEPELKSIDSKLRKLPKYQSFKLHKRIKHPSKPIASWWSLFKKAIRLLVVNKKQIAIFVIIYGLIHLLFVRGFSSTVDPAGLQESFDLILGEETSTVSSGLTTFMLFFNASAQGSGELAQIYQSMLLVISTLALIWFYRQQQADNIVSIKMAYYRGMYPLIPFILVLLVIGLQLIPALIGNFLFTSVIQGGIAVGGLEQTLWFLFFALTLLLSFYMLCSSFIALFIVTLPEMTPIKALRQARELVRHRRFSVMRKLIALIFISIAILFVLVVPVIFIFPVLAEWLFYILTILGVPFVVAYMFSLYRELL